MKLTYIKHIFTSLFRYCAKRVLFLLHEQEKSTGNLLSIIEKHYNKNLSTAMKLTYIKHIFTSFITVQIVFCFYFMSKRNQHVIHMFLLKNTTIKTCQQQ